MGTPRHQRDLHIRDRRTRQHPLVLLLRQMGQNQPLPVSSQNILAAGGSKLHTAPRLPGFQKKMDLRVMTERFEMPHALHRVRDCLPVDDAPVSEFHRETETFLNYAF